MPTTMENICMAMISGEFLVGVLVNGFIVLVNFMDLVKTKRMSTMGFILTGLAIARMGLLWTLISGLFLIILCSKLFILSRLKYLQVFWFVSGNVSAWFCTFLSIFYLLKIANFSHPIFLWMKWKVDTVIFKILMSSLMINLLICVLVMERINYIKIIYFDLENKTYMTQNIQPIGPNDFCSLMLFTLGNLVPFSLTLIACFMLFLSLFRHTQNMKLNVTGLKDSSTEAHVRAMKSVVSFLFLHVIDYMAFVISVLSQFLFQKMIIVIFALIIIKACHLFHSIILILGNSNLRKVSLKVLGKLKGCLKLWEI